MAKTGIVISGLTKSYPGTQNLLRFLRNPIRAERKTALDGLDLTISSGGIYALLGPNGAGKTTLMKAVAGLILPDSGSLSIDGEWWPSDRLRHRVGLIVSDERSFYWRLTVRENLRFFASLQGFRGGSRDQRVATCLASVDLVNVADQRFMTLSTGMRQRLAIARGLLNEPQTLLMDEPTRSLDPESSARIHALVLRLYEENQDRIVVYSTHDLAEAEAISSHVIVLRRGRIVAYRDLQDPDGRRKLAYRLRTSPALSESFFEDIDSVTMLTADGDECTIEFRSLDTLDEIIDRARRDGVRILELAEHGASLNELYHASRDEEN